MTPYVEIPAKALRLDTAARAESAHWPSSRQGIIASISSTSVPPETEAPLIYAVDDVPDLTHLYIILLERIGCAVRAFNDRAEALTALKAERTKPDLLVTDYAGVSIPIEQFMQSCLAVHPALRILVVSGCGRADVRFCRGKPDRFMQKPFTAEEFQQQVRDILAARCIEKPITNS